MPSRVFKLTSSQLVRESWRSGMQLGYERYGMLITTSSHSTGPGLTPDRLRLFTKLV